MVPTVYETGALGPADGENHDTLSIIALPLDAEAEPRHFAVSNSTNGPPAALTLSPDGRFALVAETYGRRPRDATRLDQLPQGKVIRSIDLAGEGEVAATVEIGTQPQAISLNPAGDLLAAITVDDGQELAFVPVREGRFGAVVRFGLGLPPSGGFIPLKSTWIEWHPSGRYIAVNLVDRAEVAFYEVVRDSEGAVTAIQPWGNRVQTNKFPFVGRFSPDGRFYITSDLQWGVDTKGFFGVEEGILTTVRLAGEGSSGEAALHTVPHVALGGWASETILFSPDGRFLVTSNLRGTGKADGDRQWTEEASLSLHELDRETGRLHSRGEWRFPAVQPQGLAFSKDGSVLYVGVNRYRGGNHGAVEIWNLVTEGGPRLERTGTTVRLPPGVHTLAAG
ncbi:hypothetical protein LCM4573_15430 [Rhizobium sp. LCM 4573]|nr:hypothetical protein LCM4573_15430 [Rhizobium sp. LCM 4573]